MDVWKSNNWNSIYYPRKGTLRKGLFLRFQRGINPIVVSECKLFCAWLRGQYEFPIRVPIYFKKNKYIRARDGEYVSALFFEPYDKYTEPYISIATGTYSDMEKEIGSVNAIGSILCSIAHELTHYYQWINDIQLSESGYERQAAYYAKRIVGDYYWTVVKSH